MKPRILYPRLPVNKSKDKPKIYLGTSANKGSCINLNKSKTISKNKCCDIAKKYYRKKQDRAFNQLLNSYYDDYNKFKNRHKILSKPLRAERTGFNYNLYELKKKNFNALFFNYDLKNNEDFDFGFTDGLIKSMYNGKNYTLIKTKEIKNDYDMRLNENENNNIMYNIYVDSDEDINIDTGEEKKINFGEEIISGTESSKKPKKNNKFNRVKKIKEVSGDDENIFYLKDGDQVIDDNYLDFKNKLYYNNTFPLFNEIINSNFNKDYEIPIYKTPQSAIYGNNQNVIDLSTGQALNKYKNGELKRFKDMIMDNDYPGFEQVISPYYPTDYKPPPCFPKLPEDEEEDENDEYGYEDLGFNEDNNNNKINDEDDDALILLSNQIANNEFPMYEHLIRNDFKGNYVPPSYKIPPHIEREMKKDEEKLKKNKKIYEENKNLNVENNINRYKDGELNMLENVIKDNNYPLFEQIINPYYQTNYVPPKIFPKPANLEEKQEDQNYGYGDFKLNAEKQIEGNDNDNDLVLINNAVLNNEYPMFEHLIRNDFKGNYAPPIYKIPDFLQEEEKVDINQRNAQNFNEMRGNYINYNNYEGNEYPTVNNIIQNNNIGNEEGKIETENDKKEEDEDNYNDFE